MTTPVSPSASNRCPNSPCLISLAACKLAGAEASLKLHFGRTVEDSDVFVLGDDVAWRAGLFSPVWGYYSSQAGLVLRSSSVTSTIGAPERSSATMLSTCRPRQ